MKAMTSLAFAALFFANGVFAADSFKTIDGMNSKNYYVNIKASKELNQIKIKVLHKGHTHNDLNVKLKIFEGNKTTLYKLPSKIKTGTYTFDVDLDKGRYGYLVIFNHNHGVNNYVRGSLKM